jgi:hypothetical protein
VESRPTIRRLSPGRIIIAILTLSPALAIGGFQLFAKLDLESMLAIRFQGVARPDAFDGVADIAPLFVVMFAVNSLLAACLVAFHKTPYLWTLAAGPLLAGLVYVVMHGVTDPAWFTLLALLTIGMLVGAPVTAVQLAATAKRQRENMGEA